MVAARERARLDRQWESADVLRQELRQAGVELFDKEEPPVWKSADGRTGFIFLDPTAALEAAKVAGGGELHMPEGEDEEAMRAHEALENDTMLDDWVKAKRQKNYAEADRLRDELRAKVRFRVRVRVRARLRLGRAKASPSPTPNPHLYPTPNPDPNPDANPHPNPTPTQRGNLTLPPTLTPHPNRTPNPTQRAWSRTRCGPTPSRRPRSTPRRRHSSTTGSRQSA